jgi:serine/threonine-protein kinase
VAHRAGVVHRDVTPDNIMLHGQQVTVLDFGIAARIGEPDDDSTGASFGTPAYVAPERLDGTPARAATDVYALGVVLHEMLTGSIPFRVRGWDEVALDHGEPPVIAVPGLPKQVSELVRRCLRRDPDARPEATEVALVLQRAMPHPHPLRDSRAVRWSLAAAAGVTAIALFGWWQAGPGAPDTAGSVGPTPTASIRPTGAQTAAQPAETPSASTPSTAATLAVVPVAQALGEAISTIDTAESSGQLRDDVAHDLRQMVNNLVNNSATMAAIDAGTTGIKSKIGSREREGTVSMAFAAELIGEVDQLSAALVKRIT